MKRSKPDLFAVWLGITVLALVILLFFSLVRYQPDFFRSFNPLP